MNRLQKSIGLVAFLLLSYTTATIGALATIEADRFYEQLIQPGWAPPTAVFGPVWSLFYTLMGIAAWLVWCEGGWTLHRFTLGLFLAQLASNGLWSWLFFNWKLGALAFADIMLMEFLLAWTLRRFWYVRKLAGALLLPYLGWLIFASALSGAVWQLNPHMLGFLVFQSAKSVMG